MPQFGQKSLSKLKGVHPDLVKVMMEAIKDSPIDFSIDYGVRTTAEQQALYAQGRTKPGPIVTQKDGVRKKSNHQAKADGFGRAVDLYPFINGKMDFNDTHSLDVIAAHVLATAKCHGIKIVWGGSWRTLVDKPHFELA